MSVTWPGSRPFSGAGFASRLCASYQSPAGCASSASGSCCCQPCDALRTVAAGGTVIDPEVIGKLLRRRAADEPIAALSAREREVLELMAQGRSNTAIAQRLFVSEKAVSKHSTSIFIKSSWDLNRPTTTTAASWPSSPT